MNERERQPKNGPTKVGPWLGPRTVVVGAVVLGCGKARNIIVGTLFQLKARECKHVSSPRLPSVSGSQSENASCAPLKKQLSKNQTVAVCLTYNSHTKTSLTYRAGGGHRLPSARVGVAQVEAHDVKCRGRRDACNPASDIGQHLGGQVESEHL